VANIPAEKQNIRARLSHVLATAGSQWDGRPYCQDALEEIERLRKLLLPFSGLLLPNGDLYVNACRDVRNYFAGPALDVGEKP
jgi:hypothetical protein